MHSATKDHSVAVKTVKKDIMPGDGGRGCRKGESDTHKLDGLPPPPPPPPMAWAIEL